MKSVTWSMVHGPWTMTYDDDYQLIPESSDILATALDTQQLISQFQVAYLLFSSEIHDVKLLPDLAINPICHSFFIGCLEINNLVKEITNTLLICSR
ncbi:unnamed protein product [Ambrosiozyma monospora]|uniref:Unnamed protein product n=1 Tax=Ambrosiozyma monospora TaxID=43982 RepID=A0ACB5TNJ0_AMBMO|nr:unnamed protein product [Ambrosiozyma monospora]